MVGNRPRTINYLSFLTLGFGEARYSEEMKEYESVSKSFRTGRLEGELQVVQPSATRCSCIAIF